MSHNPSANTATLILLRIGLIVVALFTALFLVLTQLQNNVAGKPLVIVIALAGLIFLALALRDLLRELNRESRTSQPSPGH
ncbi:MAG: hypothetical protein REI12_01190 [Pedobacter sp.]|nr:hypothetical protein [Pedobacter sp.]